jgi:uridine kinase
MSQVTPPAIAVSAPRNTVRVTFPDGLVLEGTIGTTIEQFLKAAQQIEPARFPTPIAGGIYDNRLRELGYAVQRDAPLAPVLLGSSDGGRIYRRSLVLLLTTAVEELFPGLRVNVSYAVPDGGFYCMLPGRAAFTDEELARVEAHMRAIVAADEPIIKSSVPLEEAKALFEARGEDDKVRLLEARTRNGLTLYTLRGRSDYYYGYMLPSTGYMQFFRLVVTDHGFILQYPTRDNPTDLGELRKYAKIEAVFEQYEEWLARLGVEDFGRLNRIMREQPNGGGDRAQELILVAEALHEGQIANIAGEIAARHASAGLRVVLIAGPSSSGKTTFSKRLSIQLLARGLRPFTLELDNYFVDRELTPRDEAGNYDFEALETVNVPLFNAQLTALIAGQEVRLPRFDFITGKSMEGLTGQLQPNQIIIVEGIHGLNPKLITDLHSDQLYRIYVSALTQLNVDMHNRVPTTDVRLLRRICRDAVTRGYNATDTITRWPSVRRGEKRYIFPYQENADVMFNSALVYELAALRPIVEPLLLQVEPGTPPHIEANRLLSFLRWVQPLSPRQQSLIPDTSLLREFIGGSILQDYHPGSDHEADSLQN